MTREHMAKMRMARFLDFEEGCLLVLTEDFKVGSGWTENVRPEFNWWVMEGAGVVGYSIDGLDAGPPDYEFLKSCDFRVVAPQFGLTNAGVDQVAESAYGFYVLQDERSAAQEDYREALICTEEARGPEDLIHALELWTSLYHLYGHGDGLYWLGFTCAELGMCEQAVVWLLRFIDLRHDNPWAHYLLGRIYSGLGDLGSAREHLHMAVFHEAMNGYETGAAGLLATLGD